MKIYKIFLTLLGVLLITPFLSAQESDSKWSFGAKIGFNVGASVPMYFQNMPDRFDWNTGFNPTIGGYAEYKLSNPRQSIHFELNYTRKGNNTTATVSDRYFKISDSYQGTVTGDVYTEITLNYIEIPILFKTPLSKKDNGWYGIAGLYFAYQLDGTFKGELLQGGTIVDEVGTVSPINRNTPYDYSHDLISFDWGAQFGIQKEFGKFTADVQVSWGFRGIFPRGYEIVDPNLFNLYGKFGLAYQIK